MGEIPAFCCVVVGSSQFYAYFLILLLSNLQEGEAAAEETKKSNHVQRKLEKRQKDRKLDPHIEEQFAGGRLLACISSRPGQCGRADGYAQIVLVFESI